MKAHHDHDQRPVTSSYTLVSDQSEASKPTGGDGRRSKSSILAGASLLILFISLITALLITQVSRQPASSAAALSSGDTNSYNWTNAMLSWQKTAFHFQPEKNWMNDPNGPLYYKGYYHIFYQYNPYSAVWGNMTWGHAVSTDLIHWKHLPVAMVPDQWYDINGVFTGSATLLPDGRIMMVYTGVTDKFMQVQNLAYPANLSDPLLLDWVKYPGNPVLHAPQNIVPKDFRDPTTAWAGPDGSWKIMIGTKVNVSTGIALVFRTNDFISYELLDPVMHAVPGTGMWECPDFFPVSMTRSNGLDTSSSGPDIKHVFMIGLFDETIDYYMIGMYDPVHDKWTPDNPNQDIGVGLRIDYGKYYASKTFFDPVKERRILYGWVPETDSQDDDRKKGWASLLTIPREVIFDKKTGTNLLQWPVEEIESLRLNFTEINKVEIGPGSLMPINIGRADQLDIVAEFEIEETASTAATGSDSSPYNLSAGAAHRGTLGPFGIITVADDSLSELTPIYFYIAKDADGNATTWFCADGHRSSKATSVQRSVYGGVVPVLDGENFSMRVLVDHSIVESYAQGGRTVITSRVYPTQAIDDNARLFIFNNATGLNVKASLKIWHLNSAFISTFP